MALNLLSKHVVLQLLSFEDFFFEFKLTGAKHFIDTNEITSEDEFRQS